MTLAFGLIGFWDDYLKLVVGNSRGLIARYKYFWQSVAGLGCAMALFYTAKSPAETALYVPFFKTVMVPLGYGYIALAYFVVVGTSNAVNLTDGLDGLAIMPAVLVGGALGVFAYATGNAVFSGYLGIPFIEGTGEILVFCATLVGAGLGFLWFNTYPAQVFMGDIGALALGAALGVVAVIVRQEIVLLIMGGVFVMETVSVMLQVASFKLHRQAHLPHGADPSSLRAEGLGRAEGDRALLDHLRDPGAGRAGDVEGALTMHAEPRTHEAHAAIVVGLGRTGLSCARYLLRAAASFAVTDSRAAPPESAALEQLAPSAKCASARFDEALLDGASNGRLAGRVAAEPFIVRPRRAACRSSATSSCSPARRGRRSRPSPARTARAR